MRRANIANLMYQMAQIAVIIGTGGIGSIGTYYLMQAGFLGLGLVLNLNLLGVNRFLTSNGLNLGALLGFAFIMGFGGAIISLLISKPVAKWSSGVHVIEQPRNADEAWIVDTVRKFADKAGIGMPEVGIYEGEPNAFATGAFKKIGRAHV